MPLLNATDAAKAAGVSKPTFYKDLKRKGISYETDEKGHKQFDPAELLRHYGELQGFNDGDVKGSKPVDADLRLENALLTRDLGHLRQQLETERERRQEAERREREAKEEAARMLAVIEKQMHLLPAPATQTSATGENEPAQRGFWDWLKGK